MFFYRKSRDKRIVHPIREEIYEIAYLLTGNQTKAHQLMQSALYKANYSLLKTKEEAFIHNLWKDYKILIKTDALTPNPNPFDKMPLLKNLHHLSEIEKMVIILRYHKEYPIKKIAKILSLSRQKVRSKLFHSIPIWSGENTAISLAQLPGVFQTEIARLEIQLDVKEVHILKIKTSSKKKFYYMCAGILVFLILGGSMNDATVDKTRASAGPDIVKIYKEGTLLQIINQKLHDLGFSECYLNRDSLSHSISIQTDSLKVKDKQEQIISAVSAILDARHIDDAVQFEYFESSEEGETIEENEDPFMKKRQGPEGEIWVEVNRKLMFADDYSSADFDGDKWILTVPDNISDEQEETTRKTIQKILNKYQENTDVTFQFYNKKQIDSMQRWYSLLDYISEGLANDEKYRFNELMIDYKNGVVQLNITTTFFSDEKGHESIVREIKRGITTFLQDKEIKKIIKKDKYSINVLATSGEKLEGE
ncbi:sigma factor-like helix-turn-helix DNA-binding protein [Niallia sp. 03190]|uniref:sigma factor-like helix-turn-helix DNA-binding protein n=1 Tax=Niallia sp. 03190 TaxID=3458061 RepID=UPI0040450A1B